MRYALRIFTDAKLKSAYIARCHLRNHGTWLQAAPFDLGITETIRRMLKLQSITNDPLNRVAVIQFAEVFDEHPQIRVVMKLPTLDSQTQAEVQNAIKALARDLLKEATHLCL